MAAPPYILKAACAQVDGNLDGKISRQEYMDACASGRIKAAELLDLEEDLRMRDDAAES